MKKLVLAYMLGMFSFIQMFASDSFKVWMNNPVIVADGNTVTYLTVYQTDEIDEYWNFEVHINLPEGLHIAQRKEGRKMVDDVTLNADRFDGTPHTIGVNMPTATSLVAICTNISSKDTYFNDDAEGEIVEELFTIGLIADEGMDFGDYPMEMTVAKFVRPDNTGVTINNPANSTISITGGQATSMNFLNTIIVDSGKYDLYGNKINMSQGKGMFIENGKKIIMQR